MYGIFTKSGALVVKFNATSFNDAYNIMNNIFKKHPNIDKRTVYLCQTTF